MQTPYINVVGLFLVHREKILLCKRSDTGLYSIPGGKVERGETYTQAIKREIFEEIDFEIQIKNLHALESLEANKHYPHFNFHLFSLISNMTPSITLNEEHTDFIWTDPKKITVDTMPRFDYALKNYLNYHD